MARQASPNALVVDDNRRWLKTLTRLARDSGYSVSTAQTYAAALLEVERSELTPDLIITDIRLIDGDHSNIDGMRLLEELHKRGQLRASIVVTGYPSIKTRRIAKRLGAVYLVKGNFSREDFRCEMKGIKKKRSINSSQCSLLRRRFALSTI